MNARRPLLLALLLVATAAVAVAGCLLSRRLLPHRHGEGAELSHAWIHRELALTPEQERRLEPLEDRFAAERSRYAEEIRRANRELAEAILAEKADSPRVEAAVGEIHRAMGALQKATLDHVFAMRDVLTPEQYGKLLRLTAESLRGHG